MAPKPPLSWSSLVVTLLANVGAIAAVKAPADVPSAVVGIIVAVAGLVNLVYVHQRHLTIRAAMPTAPTVDDVGKVLGAVGDALTRLEGIIAGAAPLAAPAQTSGVAPYHAEPGAPAP